MSTAGRRPLGPVNQVRNPGRVRVQRAQFCPPGASKYASASQEVAAAAQQNKDKDKDKDKENTEGSDSDDDVPVGQLAARRRGGSRRITLEDADDGSDDDAPPPDDDGLPRDLAERALMREQQEYENTFSPPADQHGEGYDTPQAPPPPAPRRPTVDGVSDDHWERRAYLVRNKMCDFPDAMKGGNGHLVRFMLKYGKNLDKITNAAVRRALESAVAEIDPEGKMHPMDIYARASQGQRGLISLGWWTHNEKVSKGAGEKLKWSAFKGNMNEICSYCRLYENVDRPFEEQQRIQVRYGTGWKHDSHPAYKALHKAVNDDKKEIANVSVRVARQTSERSLAQLV